VIATLRRHFVPDCNAAFLSDLVSEHGIVCPIRSETLSAFILLGYLVGAKVAWQLQPMMIRDAVSTPSDSSRRGSWLIVMVRGDRREATADSITHPARPFTGRPRERAPKSFDGTIPGQRKGDKAGAESQNILNMDVHE
jgi:hypothetical protein